MKKNKKIQQESALTYNATLYEEWSWPASSPMNKFKYDFFKSIIYIAALWRNNVCKHFVKQNNKTQMTQMKNG